MDQLTSVPAQTHEAKVSLFEWLRYMGNPKEFKKPVYCVKCGAPLVHDTIEHFDRYTGELTRKTDPYNMHCSNPDCNGWASQGKYDHWHTPSGERNKPSTQDLLYFRNREEGKR